MLYIKRTILKHFKVKCHHLGARTINTAKMVVNCIKDIEIKFIKMGKKNKFCHFLTYKTSQSYMSAT